MLLDLGRANDCPKHVELIQRSVKLLLLHIVGHLYYSSTLMMHGQTQIKYTDWYEKGLNYMTMGLHKAYSGGANLRNVIYTLE
jgi:hypothetical protein